ncbi:hypothetical protein BL3420_10030 [Bifidobacterium longum subsp. longum]|uniref:hypothetical protein n=1 Tax=Bifidobacterium longum TaxID=216816 RepID=UPI0018A6131B|nr:hypothetical protein [Bifidobacterium longum]QOL57272.1 hypothetical protein BL3420_10030 [Bifidobacterium longum subsp. longum]WNW21338.1 hypothetical protein RS866_10095 [Bifidobacterium longum]
MRRGSSSGFPARPAAGAGGNSSRSRSKGSTLSGVGFSKERISQYRKQGLSDERISKLWQDTLKMRALMKKRKEQGVSDLEAGVFSVMEETPRHAETGRSTSGSTTNGTDTAVQAGNGRSRFFLSTSLLERRWIVRNLFQRAGKCGA